MTEVAYKLDSVFFINYSALHKQNLDLPFLKIVEREGLKRLEKNMKQAGISAPFFVEKDCDLCLNASPGFSSVHSKAFGLSGAIW